MYIDSIFRPLQEVESQAAISNLLQMTDCIDWILQQTGPASLTVSSFSVSEELVRRLFFLKKKGMISHITMLLDFKATNKILSLWKFIFEVADKVLLADNHSKVLLIEARNHCNVSVLTSQNLTRGNRSEAYMISTSDDIFNALSKDIDNIISNHSIPLDDLLSQKLAGY